MAKIVAIVTIEGGSVGGGAPIFVEPDTIKRESTAFLLEKILDANAHDLKNGSFILVDHRHE
ncbi:hypothetical protein Back11_23590 [Paenibacillus baekrokdamisoli]|uniref:Uncharacterized protein n=1 Tax=Paenibacillus baekrokdamisoli TaxID=1712516 RepID=A0A3G9JCR3_9BACL|nr:hypothetical protein [Paenibacillus baekrokdamisoli]MBB3069632.1 hypothetical protein [Paenibacillus baekrokdamisoli]BBH21014.1 hypothetical protein Back11_23590 [Paenibacillus baekrokdamisoli]